MCLYWLEYLDFPTYQILDPMRAENPGWYSRPSKKHGQSAKGMQTPSSLSVWPAGQLQPSTHLVSHAGSVFSDTSRHDRSHGRPHTWYSCPGGHWITESGTQLLELNVGFHFRHRKRRPERRHPAKRYPVSRKI